PSSAWTKPGVMVSNGPYRLKRWTPAHELVVEANPFYWNASQIKLKEIRFHPIESLDTEERAFRSGQLHATYTMPTNRIPAYRASSSPALRVTERLGLHFLFL